MKKETLFFITFSMLFIFLSCSSEDKNTDPIVTEPPVIVDPPVPDDFIRAADVSFLPEIESANVVLYNSQNQPEKMLTTLKKAGCNAIRIRLWKDPINGNSGMTEVKSLVSKVKAEGMKVWITVHYSDTWADPGSQTKPLAWKNLTFLELKSALVTYTSLVLSELKPDIIQIGNETNDGFLWPSGKITTNEAQFLELMSAASLKIRNQSPSTKIMLHYGGINFGTNTAASWFFNKAKTIDYDYIGLSYYPQYHGKLLTDVKATIDNLGALYNKKVIVAETSYPFTLGYNDWTDNVIGLQSQLIPEYSATANGQTNYLLALKSVVKQTNYGIGFAYWGTEWIAFKGNQAKNGSTYENQALWDFSNKVLPAIKVFNKD